MMKSILVANALQLIKYLWPDFLSHFGMAKHILKIENPSVGMVSVGEEEEKGGRKARLSLVQAELEAIIAKQSESGRCTRKVDHQNTDLEWSAVTDNFDAVEWESLCEKGRRIMRLE